VTFTGSFSGHPLRGGVAPGETGTGATQNPIANIAAGTSMPFTFPAPGLYPYYCVFHAGSGMVGVIQVR
jgi:plastocyanin